MMALRTVWGVELLKVRLRAGLRASRQSVNLDLKLEPLTAVEDAERYVAPYHPKMDF